MPEEFECEECGRSFDTKRGLASHKTQAHEDSESSEEDSDRIDFSFTVRQALVGVFALGLLAGFTAGIFYSGAVDGPTAEPTADSQQDSDTITLEGIDLENEPSLGSADAEVKVVEYSDFGCPWCAEWAGYDAIPQRDIDKADSLNKLKSNYVDTGKIQFIYKDYPAHTNSPEAHAAANCAYEQSNEKFWEFHDQLYERRDSWMQSEPGQENRPTETFNAIASDIGLDEQAFSQCTSQSSGEEATEDAQKIGQAQGRIGTPTFFIGNQESGFEKVSGAQPYSRIKQVIDSKLE
jgi:protein-disulfide isomerase